MIARVLTFATALASLVACNAVTGINDYSTPTCEECERKECADAFSACRADMRCANVTMCIETCASPACADRCVAPSGGPDPRPDPRPDGSAPPDGAPPPLDPDGGLAAKLMACAQTRCPVCSPR